MIELARKAEGMSECPATGLRCVMARACTFAEEMASETSGAMLAGRCCLRHTRGIGASLTCTACLHRLSETCEFNCFRVERRGKISMAFYRDHKKPASKSADEGAPE